MNINTGKRKVHMNASQYLEVLRAKEDGRRIDVTVMYTPLAAHVLRVRVH